MKLPINGKIGSLQSTETLILEHNNIQKSKEILDLQKAATEKEAPQDDAVEM
jgi:hypothetical protein